MAAQRTALGDAVDDPLRWDELRDGLLERRQRPDLQLPYRTYAVALPVFPVAPAGDLGAEDLREVLVLGEVGKETLRGLGEVVLDVNVVGSHVEEAIARSRPTGGRLQEPLESLQRARRAHRQDHITDQQRCLCRGLGLEVR